MAALALAAIAPPAAPAGLRAPDGGAVAWGDVPAPDRATVLVFSTLWCEICRREEPAVAAWAEANAPRARTVVVVSGSAPEKVAAAAPSRRWGAPLRVLVDEDGELARAFEVAATPTLVVLRPGGDLAGRFHRIADVSLDGGAAAAAAATDDGMAANHGMATDDRMAANSGMAANGGAEAGAHRRTFADTGQELGTTYDVTVVSGRDAETVRRDLAFAREHCRDLARQLSEWREDSEISRVNRDAAAAPVPVSDPLRRILTGALQVTAVTGGAFDVTWKTMEPVWERAAARDALPAGGELEEARRAMGPENVILEAGAVRLGHPATRLGIAGVAKGWIIDAVFLHLRRAGYDDVLVNIGGDLRAAGAAEDGTPHVIEIADPYRPGAVAGRLDVRDTAIATSGNYLRTRRIAGRDVGHILDPRTGWPPDFDGSVTVLAPDAAMADALATALFVLGPDAGLALVRELDGVEAVFATRDGLRSSVAAP
jgi:thiamine biosynthesis lipoprotein